MDDCLQSIKDHQWGPVSLLFSTYQRLFSKGICVELIMVVYKTSWLEQIFLEKLWVPQLDKTWHCILQTRRFLNAHKGLPLSCVHSRINPVHTHHIFLISIFISFHWYLGVTVLIFSSFQIRTLRACLLSPVRATLPIRLILWSPETYLVWQYRS